jgi:hypothetical protein
MRSVTEAVGVLLGIALSACGGSSAAPPVTWSASPASGNLLPDTQIVITFSASMQNGTATLGGTLGGESPVDVWSDGARHTDTVTVRPITGDSWALADVATLTLGALDLEGRMVEVSLPDYGVIAAANACGTAGGACVDTAGCPFTDRQLAGWADACAAAHAGAVTLTCMSISEHPLATACVDCYATAASCKQSSCSAATIPPGPCLASPTSSDCLACVATSCTPDFEVCSGR